MPGEPAIVASLPDFLITQVVDPFSSPSFASEQVLKLVRFLPSLPPKANGASVPAPATAVPMSQSATAVPAFDEDDAKALQEMTAVMSRQPHEAGVFSTFCFL